MRKKLAMLITSLFLVLGTAWAQAPVATPTEAITGLLNRIGGDGAASMFEIVIDASLAENGKDVFIITSQNSKPCIKGNTQLSVATGINWYLNHYAHVNLTWNNLTTDLSKVELPLPGSEEKHVCNTTYRYDFNTCTFSYSMAFWTWERWQQEIDWMALHGINAPLNLVGLDVVTRKFLRELGVSENDINAYIAGPGFIAWFAMNNLEGWGSTINATDVTMNGNPDWWYERQEALCKKMLQRMRELGMQPVIPGFSGQVPDCIRSYDGRIDGFSASHVLNNGTWAGGYTRPDMLFPNSTTYEKFAAVYYKHLHEVMGISEFYSIDPFHEGGKPDAITNEQCYPNIMRHLDIYHDAVSNDVKTTYRVNSKAKWIIQYWQNIPQTGAFSSMNSDSYKERFIGLDLFADNIYDGQAAKWQDANISSNYFKGRPYIYCMLHNFGGRSGMHGRLETTMNGYFQALAKNNNCQGIGATPEGIETNPILYDMLFELPWMDPATRPSADEWLEDYAYSRYGIQNSKALSALQNLKKSVWNCQRNQQGTSEAIILGRPRWTFGDAQRNDGTSLEGRSVSSWSKSSIYWDTQDVLLAADDLYSIKDLITTEDGRANFDYDFIEVVRQSMVDQASLLLPLVKAARNNGDNAEYERLYKMFLQLMLDLDEMLSYDENFKLERWTSLARNIANEATGTNVNDRNWLEWNARTQVTVWSFSNSGLNDYSNRCWAGLIKDFHYPRWKYFFENNGGVKDGNWFTSEKAWTVNFTDYDYSTVTIPGGKTATEKAAETFGNYFGRVKGATKNYIFPMGITTNATKCDVTPTVNRGQTVEIPLIIGKNVTISSVWVDLNNDGAKGNGETLNATNNQVAIPANAVIGKTTAQVVYSDGTDITFNLALVEEISEERTVTAVAGANGSVAIEGTNALSITNAEAVKMTATANTGYNFEKWTDAQGNTVSNDNPYIYYGKEAATFTANFIQDKWGVVACGEDVDGEGTVKDEAAVMADISNNTQYIPNLTLTYYNREAETVFEPTTAPTSIFTTIPQIINVPQGASFTVTYGNRDNFKHCYFRAYIDLNADGDFDDEGELLKEVGTRGAQNTAVCSNSINVLLPYNMPLGITHMRLRFDSAWNIGEGAKSPSVRPVYELIINVTEGSSKAAHIVVESNNDEWGTAEVWTEETPGWTASNEWDVSTGIYAQIKATKASEDVEFLGWYDQYGRLLTSELEYSMLAREDATYTARFRKALDINGWQFEYRTEPGSEIITNKLANGVKPEAGKTYYIYAPTRPTNDGEYVNRYLYNNSGTLTLSTTESTAASYLWVCGVEDGKYTFQNVADPTKYLMHKGLSNSSYGFELGMGTTYYEGITLQSVPGNGESRNLFFVINDDGSDFNQSTRAHNQSTEDYTTDFVFTEVTYPNVVVLTSVRQSGNHDLVIPETVEILGEQCKIVGFDNNLFNNNKDLWTISLPQTIQFLSEKSLFNHTLTGNGNTQIFDVDIKNNEGWTITMDVVRTGELTGWGSCLIASGSIPAKADGQNYAEGFQFYLQSPNNPNNKTENDKLIIKTKTQKNDDWYFDDVYQESKFTVVINYNGAQQLSVNVLKADGTNATNHNGQQGPIVFTDCTIQDIKQLCTNVQSTIAVHVEIDKAAESDPFEGCSNLLAITVANGCTNYRVADGKLYNASDFVLHTLADAEKEEEIRALGELIDNTEALMDIITTSINPVGKATEIALTTTQGSDFYVSSNADQNTGGGSNDGGGIAALVDNKEGTYFHTRWGGTVVNEPHYIQVDLGANNLMNYFKFTYKPRNGSPAPTAMTVYGSNDGVTFTDVLATINSGLPAHDSGKTYESAAIDSKRYRYLRFAVTGSAGPGNNKYGNQYFFGMLEFDLFKLTSTVEVETEYQEIAKITSDETANVYDNLVNALYFYNNGGTAGELQAAYDALKPLYDAVNDKKESLQYIKDLTLLIGDTDALINSISTSVNPVGKATEIALQATNEELSNYIWCNAPTADEGVANLLDGQDGTILHTEWNAGSVSAYQHYLLVSVDVADLYNFSFRYKARTGNSNNMDMGDIPSGIKVYGSNEKDGEYTELYTVSGLTQSSGNDWTSPAIDMKPSYRYLRFNVTANNGYWHMAEFDLFKLTSEVEVASEYQEIAGITNEEATAAYDLMPAAQNLCDNGGTVAELEAALNDLQTSYDALKAKKDIVTYALKLDELNELITATNDLMGIIAASIEPVIELDLTTEEGSDYFVSTNADQNTGGGNKDGAGIAGLVDGTVETYFHSRWGGSAVNAPHHIKVDLGKGNEMSLFKFCYVAHNAPDPKEIVVSGSNNGTDFDAIETITKDVTAVSGTYTSKVFEASEPYRYLLFEVTNSERSGFGANFGSYKCFGMKEFYLFKPAVEVAPGYKNLAGITDEEATTAYDLMVAAQNFYNNGGTLDELNTLYDALKASYDALNAKQSGVLNGYYHILHKGNSVSVQYEEASNAQWPNYSKGYKMVGNATGFEVTEADKIFLVTPTENGYIFSAQGMYMGATSNGAETWDHILFVDGKENAGEYVLEGTKDEFKLRSASSTTALSYVTNYTGDPEIFGNDKEHLDEKIVNQLFQVTPVTTYKVTISDNGILPLYLPFNVVLPENVTAYDITATTLNEQALLTGEGLMAEVAKAGDILKAGTPVILKGFPGYYTLNITMNDEDAKTSSDGSVFRGTYVNKTLSASDSYKTFVFDAENKSWKTITDETSEVLANSCWIEANIDADEISLDIEVVEINNWKFRYVPTTNDGIKLTDALIEGDGELVIPSTITIGNETKTIVALSTDFMHDETKLTSVTIPATMTNLGFRDLEPMFEGSYKGEPGDYGVFDKSTLIEGQGHNRCYEFPIDPVTRSQFVVTSETAWKLTLDVTISDPDASFNNYGSSVVSTLPNSLADSYTNGHMQIYLRKESKEITVKIDNADDRYMYTLPVLDNEGNETGELVAHDHFIFELEHDGYGGYQVVIYYDDGRAKMYNITASSGNHVADFSRLYYSLPEGINVDVKFEKLVSQGLFVGCTSLTEIKVDPANPTFMGCEHGVLYDKNQYYVMRIPEGGGELGENGRRHFDIPSKVVKLYPGAVHDVNADIVLHSNPQIGVVEGHEHHVENAKFYLSLDDMDPDPTVNGARDFISTNNNTYVSANYKRAPLGEGKYGTICLPFETNGVEMNKYDFFELTDASATSFHFSPVYGNLKEQKPYLYKLKDTPGEMKMEGDLDVFEGGGFTVKTLAKYDPNDEKPGDFRALGAYVNHYIETADKKSNYYIYQSSTNQFHRVTKKLTYRPYRALFVVTPEEGQAAQAPARLGLRIGGTTEIDPSQIEGWEEDVYYDLQGRRVENPTQGIYIVNGKKVVVK